MLLGATISAAMITSQPIKTIVLDSPDGSAALQTVTEGTWTKLFGAVGSDATDTLALHRQWRAANLGHESGSSYAVRVVNTSATESLAISYCTQGEFDNGGDLRYPGPAATYAAGHVRGIVPPASVWEDQVSPDLFVLATVFNPSAPSATADCVAYMVL